MTFKLPVVRQDMYAGWHLTYDGFVDQQGVSRLADEEFISSFLPNLLSFLDIKIISTPSVGAFPYKGTGEEGVMAMCMVSMGYSVIYTWPSHSRFSLDLFSRKAFVDEDAMAYIANSLSVTRRASRFSVRNWP